MEVFSSDYLVDGNQLGFLGNSSKTNIYIDLI